MTAMAAVAMGVAFTSCSHNTDLYGGEEGGGKINGRTAKEQIELDKAVYKAVFEQSFGKVAPTVDWGFGPSTRAMTRTITVNGDSYDKFPSTDEINSYFPTAIPEGADEVSELESKYRGTTIQGQWGPVTMYDIYAIYQNLIKEGYNLKITKAGTFELGGSYQNVGQWISIQGHPNGGYQPALPYNVYVDVEGDVTIRRNGATHFNLYILRGNVTLESNYGQQAGIISVASGATLNDGRNSVAANQGIKLYNRGTVNATNTEKYDIGNFCTVYNEGEFNVSGPLTYSPGDANTSFFMNHTDNAELVAPAMILNSSGNFFNDGKVTINGATTVTNAGIYWVNAGHYTTNTMSFSAQNGTFYNYCNLICLGNAHMYDGEFNLMDNSYTEAGSAEMDNFIVNMGSNTGMNIKGNLDLTIGQGDGTYQGFRTSGANDFLRVAGTVTVAEHKYTLQLTGDITYAFNNLIDLGANNSGVQPTYLFNSGTKEAEFDKLTVTPKEFGQGCGATWKKDGDEPETYRVIAEDLSVDNQSDFDFNDVVFDVDPDDDGYGATITIYAAGGIWPLTINGEEIHEKLIPGIQKFDYKDKKTGETYQCYPMINTEAAEHGESTSNRPTISVRTDEKVWDSDDNIRNSIRDYIHLIVFKYDDTDGEELYANEGDAACKILVDKNFKINSERNNIANGTKFKDFVTGKLIGRVWW